MLTITLGLPSSAKGATVGLTGTYDDNQENDLTYLNGTGYISVNSSESEIFEWASTCKLKFEINILKHFNLATFFLSFMKFLNNWTSRSANIALAISNWLYIFANYCQLTADPGLSDFRSATYFIISWHLQTSDLYP